MNHKRHTNIVSEKRAYSTAARLKIDENVADTGIGVNNLTAGAREM